MGCDSRTERASANDPNFPCLPGMGCDVAVGRRS
jgi:hypothetical protein